MHSHEHYMQRALELAGRGVGCTSPNPLVGCVVVQHDTIVGEGWHAIYGRAHAEVNAIRDAIKRLDSSSEAPLASMGSDLSGSGNSASDNSASGSSVSGTPAPGRSVSGTSPHGNSAHGSSAKANPAKDSLLGATLYVTLEPCNHHGLTPPCTHAILEAGIAKVVYALPDPNPKAAGGAKFLESQGIEVVHRVLEQEAAFQNRFFVSFVARKRPYVLAKSATSLDGRIATHAGDSQWITGDQSRLRAHQLRQSVDAIIVGADTVIADDPSLSTRLPEELCNEDNIRHPRPVIMDSTGRVPLNKQLLAGNTPHTRTLIATTDAMPQAHRQQLESLGLEVLTLSKNPTGKGVDPAELLQALAQRGLQSVLLEGGASLQGSFRDASLIDEVWAFIAPMLIGGEQAPAAYAAAGSRTLGEATRLSDVRLETLGDDVLVRGLVQHSQQDAKLAQQTLVTTEAGIS